MKITEEPGVSSTGKREEEGLFDLSGGEGERPGEEELRDGREALHSSKREPDAPPGTFCIGLAYLARTLQICVLFNYLSYCQIWFSTCYASSVMDTITLCLYSTLLLLPSELKPLSYNRIFIILLL